MTSKEIEQNIQQLVENLQKESFIYDFLLAFGFAKASVKRLEKGDFNMSKVEGETLYKGKIFFSHCPTQRLMIETKEKVCY